MESQEESSGERQSPSSQSWTGARAVQALKEWERDQEGHEEWSDVDKGQSSKVGKRAKAHLTSKAWQPDFVRKEAWGNEDGVVRDMPQIGRQSMAKADLMSSSSVMALHGKDRERWVKAMRKELDAFLDKEALSTASPQELEQGLRERVKSIPCKMVFSRKPVNEQQQREDGLEVPWKEKARI